MFKLIKKSVFALFFIICFFIILSCDNKTSSSKMELSEFGISLNIPSGWKSDDLTMCHKGEYNTGIILHESLNGRTFEEAASEISNEFGAKVISTENMQIDGYPAIKTLISMPNGTYTLRVYINIEDEIITISFTIENKDKYLKYESDLLDAINSIHIG